MSIDYEQLKTLVEEAISEDLNIMEPSGPEGVPHRMPAADPSKEEGDPKTNELYELALVAREATEKLVEALDEPVYDRAFEQAFKATTCLRRALNSLEESGAYPHAQDRVVAPPPGQQRYSSIAGAYAGGGGLGIGGGVYGANYLDEAKKESARLAKITRAGGGSEIQSPEDIDASLDAIVDAQGVTPQALRDALIKFLSDLGIQSPESSAQKIALAVLKRKKGI
jgi:hypothetical protein